jgi:DNA repair exonuclease SbcCD ATPase subunit
MQKDQERKLTDVNEGNLNPVAMPTIKHDADAHVPVWIKIFGGSIVSAVIFLLLTLAGYIVNNSNNLQNSINVLNSDCVHKTEFNERLNSTWATLKDVGPLKEKVNSIEDSLKNRGSSVDNLKERVNAIEQLAKERALWMEKIETRLSNSEKNMDAANKEIAALKEKISAQEQSLKTIQEENKQFVKDIQSLRERLVVIEGKKLEEKK